jgi:hypothetical protein
LLALLKLDERSVRAEKPSTAGPALEDHYPASERLKVMRFRDRVNLNEFTLFDSEEGCSKCWLDARSICVRDASDPGLLPLLPWNSHPSSTLVP